MQRRQVDHHAVADHRLHPGPQNAARDQLQNELLFPDEDRVAGVVPALIARDDIEALGQKVDYFALAFVAPLRAENDHVTHCLKRSRVPANYCSSAVRTNRAQFAMGSTTPDCDESPPVWIVIGTLPGLRPGGTTMLIWNSPGATSPANSTVA